MDNGLEYCNKSVQQMLATLGIRHERTNVYSPQQNGVAERVNHVLLEGVRTLLKAANLKESFWLEALQTVNYIRNGSLHRSIESIPFTRWHKRKPLL